MELDAAVQTPATEEAISAPVEANDDALSAIYDKLTAQEPISDEPVAEEAVEAAEPEAEAAPEPVEAPTDLPLALKEKWAAIPEDARAVIAEDRRKLSAKMAEAGRIIQGMEPVHRALATAAKELPALANMRPDQVASEVLQLAKISQAFNAKPVETLIGLMRQHGVEAKVREALSAPAAQGDSNALQAEIATLRQQLARVSDPEYLRTQVAQVTTQERVMGDVQTFAQSAEHWQDVEAYLPRVIPLVQEKLGAGASPSDVLTQAYELAVSIYKPDAKAMPQPAAPAQAAAAPQQVEAVMKAKSVNVAPRPSGNPKPLTEEERLAAIYDRATRK